MIVLEPLADHHRIPSDIPSELWRDKAVAAVKDGDVIAVFGARLEGDAAVLGLWLTDEMRRHPVFLCRQALQLFEGMRQMGIRKLKAGADDERGARFLERLGFVHDNGWYVKCLQPRS